MVNADCVRHTVTDIHRVEPASGYDHGLYLVRIIQRYASTSVRQRKSVFKHIKYQVVAVSVKAINHPRIRLVKVSVPEGYSLTLLLRHCTNTET